MSESAEEDDDHADHKPEAEDESQSQSKQIQEDSGNIMAASSGPGTSSDVNDQKYESDQAQNIPAQEGADPEALLVSLARRCRSLQVWMQGSISLYFQILRNI